MKYKANANSNPIESELYLPYYRKTLTYNQLCVDIDEPFRDPSYYRMVTQAIGELEEGDQVKIRFNSPGGNAWRSSGELNLILT